MNWCAVRHKYEWVGIPPYLNDKCVVCVLMYIAMLSELEDPNFDQWRDGLRYVHQIGGFLCSLEVFAMSHYKNGIISPLCNKFSTAHY